MRALSMTKVELYRYLDDARLASPETMAAVKHGLSIIVTALDNDPVKILGIMASGVFGAADRAGIDAFDAVEVTEEILDEAGAR
jgi:hypothetical protein